MYAPGATKLRCLLLFNFKPKTAQTQVFSRSLMGLVLGVGGFPLSRAKELAKGSCKVFEMQRTNPETYYFGDSPSVGNIISIPDGNSLPEFADYIAEINAASDGKTNVPCLESSRISRNP